MSTVYALPLLLLPSSPPLQMEIFDAYVEDLIQQEKAKEKAKAGKSTMMVGGGREGERKKGSSELQVD